MSRPQISPVPDDFHALYDVGSRAARGLDALSEVSETPGHRRLAQEVRGLDVQYDETTGLPKMVKTTEPAARLARGAATPDEAVIEFIMDRRDLWRMSADDAASVEVAGVSRRGLTTVKLIQRVEGKEVFDVNVVVALGPENEVISISGQLFPGVASEINRGAARTETSISPALAICDGLRDLTGVRYVPNDFAEIETRPGSEPYHFYELRLPANDSRPGLERPVRLKDVVFPLAEDTIVPGYYLELWVEELPAFAYVIRAVDEPEVLFRKNLTAGACFTYWVYNSGDAIYRPEDGPAPGTPHPTGAPNGYQAATIAETGVDMESLLPGDPWLSQGAAETIGNNCVAYADLTGARGLGPGDVPGRVSAPGVFKHIYDHGLDASHPTNLQASLVGMFFQVNWLHDRWYEAGFDEVSGNAQQDNYGRGGLGGDPILAEGNDKSGTDNANMATPADGASPRMQMYEFIAPPGPSRTSNHEALITFHEMGHYVTNRLIGNAAGLTNQQGRAMGEGWGDFFAICMTSQDGDDFDHGAFAAGGWTDLTSSFAENYYFGIRRYPYSADVNKNPLTFRHIADGVLLPSNPPINGNPNGNNQVHNAGEVWCSMLWEVFVNLVRTHGHEEGEQRMLRYVINGLKLTPSRPTYTEGRDGIIGAVSALAPSDLDPVWRGFAKRGIGQGAVSPGSNSVSLAGVVESYNVP